MTLDLTNEEFEAFAIIERVIRRVKSTTNKWVTYRKLVSDIEAVTGRKPTRNQIRYKCQNVKGATRGKASGQLEYNLEILLASFKK